jgi:ABC-type multidrug transport system permease subunit
MLQLPPSKFLRMYVCMYVYVHTTITLQTLLVLYMQKKENEMKIKKLHIKQTT